MTRTGTSGRHGAGLPLFLVIEAAGCTALRELLGDYEDLGCRVDHAGTIAAALAGGGRAPDVVLVDAQADLEGLASLRSRLPHAAILVVGGREHEQRARHALECGAHEWLQREEDDETSEGIRDVIERVLVLGPRAALPRGRPRAAPVASLLAPEAVEPPRAPPPAVPQPPAAEAVSPPLATPPAPRPAEPPAPVASRHALELLELHAVGPDGAPERALALVPASLHASGARFELVLESAEAPDARTLLMRLASATPGRAGWIATEVVGGGELAGGRWLCVLEPAPPPRDFFAPVNLLPTFDTERMRYRLPAIGTAGREWVALGVLHEVELDRVLVCPRCRSLATFRPGCRRCGSARMESQRLIHHFACAHVALAREFQHEDGMACRKCGARTLVVNADFEYLDGPNVCGECGRSDSQIELIGHCFLCAQRFLAHVAVTLELRGFDAERLDPVDLGLPA